MSNSDFQSYLMHAEWYLVPHTQTSHGWSACSQPMLSHLPGMSCNSPAQYRLCVLQCLSTTKFERQSIYFVITREKAAGFVQPVCSTDCPASGHKKIQSCK